MASLTTASAPAAGAPNNPPAPKPAAPFASAAAAVSSLGIDRVVVISILLAIVLAAVLAFFIPILRLPLILIGAIVAGIGIFPLTYFAYLHYRAPAQRKRLEDDFRLLGLAGENELDEVVGQWYDTTYSSSHFFVFISLIVILCLLIGAAFVHDAQFAEMQGLPWVSYAPGTTVATAADAAAAAAAQAAAAAAANAEAGAPEANTAGAAAEEAARQAAGAAAAAVTAQPSRADPRSTLVYFAFLGAYLFAVQELVRRYNTFDLLPQVYSSIFVRMLLAAGIVYVGATLIAALFGADANAGPLAMITAFLIGIFPQRGIDWLSERVKNTFDTKMSFASVRPLTEIIGISPWHQARLTQMGIDDAQNLAMVDMRKLLLTTQFDTEVIVNWIDQAILYVKVGSKIASLRENYINTFYELASALAAGAGAATTVTTILSLGDDSGLQRVTDVSNYPNYAHIQEYYKQKSEVARQRAEEGAGVIFGTRVPYLAADIQNLDEDVSGVDPDDLAKKIGKLAKWTGKSKSGAKYWAALGTHKQMLARVRYAALRRQQAELSAQFKAARVAGGAADDAALAAAVAADVNTAVAPLEQQVADLQNQARAAFDAAIRQDPDTAEFYVRRADWLLQHRLVLNHDDSPEIPPGDVELALQDCTKAIERNQAYAMAYNHRARAYIEQDNISQALADFDSAIEANDCLAVAYMNRGTFYNSAGEFPKAIADFQRAYYCGAKKPLLYANWGKALLGLNEDEAAIQKLSQAIAMQPDLAQAYADRGYAYYELGELDKARADCLRAIEKDPSRAVPHVNLGLVEASTGRHEEAIKQFDLALEKDDAPQDRARLYRGLSNQALGKMDAAVVDLEQALARARTEEGRVEARLALGLAYAESGKKEAAKAAYDAVISSPDATDAQRAQAQKMSEKLV